MIGDFTVARLGGERLGSRGDVFYIFGSLAAQSAHMRWFEAHLPPHGEFRDVTVAALDLSLCGLSIAGPRARDVLQGLVHTDISDTGFPFLSFASMDVGMIPALVGRITFTGDLGYEIWVAPDYLQSLYEVLRTAGAAHGLRLFGLRALNALRLEKSFGSWASEYRPIYGPFAAGLGRFVALDKNRFIGQEAAREEQRTGPRLRLITLVVAAEDADVMGNEPIWHQDAVVGWVTSGGYAHYVEASVALGYVPAALADARDFEVEVLGHRRPATRAEAPLFDPQGTRMRGS